MSDTATNEGAAGGSNRVGNDGTESTDPEPADHINPKTSAVDDVDGDEETALVADAINAAAAETYSMVHHQRQIDQIQHDNSSSGNMVTGAVAVSHALDTVNVPTEAVLNLPSRASSTTAPSLPTNDKSATMETADVAVPDFPDQQLHSAAAAAAAPATASVVVAEAAGTGASVKGSTGRKKKRIRRAGNVPTRKIMRHDAVPGVSMPGPGSGDTGSAGLAYQATVSLADSNSLFGQSHQPPQLWATAVGKPVPNPHAQQLPPQQQQEGHLKSASGPQVTLTQSQNTIAEGDGGEQTTATAATVLPATTDDAEVPSGTLTSGDENAVTSTSEASKSKEAALDGHHVNDNASNKTSSTVVVKVEDSGQASLGQTTVITEAGGIGRQVPFYPSHGDSTSFSQVYHPLGRVGPILGYVGGPTNAAGSGIAIGGGPGVGGTGGGSLSKHDEKWNAMFEVLLEYKRKHNHTMVPQSYKENPRLGRWVHYQRVEYWVFMAEGKGKITHGRIARLNSIGFEWDPQKAQWDLMYQRLLKFKEKNGNCKVPKNWKDDKELSNWVRNQRLEHANMLNGKKSRLTNGRLEKLNAIGFIWSTPIALSKRVGKNTTPRIDNSSIPEPVSDSPDIPTIDGPPVENYGVVAGDVARIDGNTTIVDGHDEHDIPSIKAGDNVHEIQL